MAKSIRLGRRVLYRDSAGFEKLAFITATNTTVKSGTGVAQPKEDEAHLFIVSPTGKTYERKSIKQGEGPRTFTIL